MNKLSFDFATENRGGGSGGGNNGGNGPGKWSDMEALAWEKGYYHAQQGLAPDLHHIPDYCQKAYKSGWEAGRR